MSKYIKRKAIREALKPHQVGKDAYAAFDRIIEKITVEVKKLSKKRITSEEIMWAVTEKF